MNAMPALLKILVLLAIFLLASNANAFTVRYPLSNYAGIWRELHLEAHASGNACVLEVDPKSQLPYIWTSQEGLHQGGICVLSVF